ncbi:hypothetical protein ES319_D03G022600v1 [Gossypium barbadense]|uniref:Uncharacterized protein n=3 Tax=Gossypium TaxID=3633 RepID=A0A5J5S4E4_GOSBA|nr:hypothetical protein ES319_D03G022600v1 [Gossypium barbadense]TYG75366.1 hypothetical protein ES288_D03G024900v1 [Gossypium darwinii]TYH78929.1 hypothetical protein ES332_D03G024700v1 [Gossypium tomentosum]
MAYQDLVVVALVFMAVVGVFSVDSSTSPAPSKASSPSKPLSSSSPAFSPKTSSSHCHNPPIALLLTIKMRRNSTQVISFCSPKELFKLLFP